MLGVRSAAAATAGAAVGWVGVVVKKQAVGAGSMPTDGSINIGT